MSSRECGIGEPYNAQGEQWLGYATLITCMILVTVITILILLIERIFGTKDETKSTQKHAEEFLTAGGRIKAGLGATVIVSQWTWAATLQQSSTVAFKYGVSGPLWYAAGATVQILLFAILAITLKKNASACKTFLEIIRLRYGVTAHIVYIFFALFANILVTAMLLLGGAAALHSTTNTSKYVVVLLFPLGYVIYTLIGGLRAKIISCYFNTAVTMFILLLFCFTVYLKPGSGEVYSITNNGNLELIGDCNYIGSANRMYQLLTQRSEYASYWVEKNEKCIEEYPVYQNEGASFLTMSSSGGLMFGIINIVGNFGTVFVDQSYWQCAVSSHPLDTVNSFHIGGLVWFAIPFALATSLGFAAQALGGLGITMAEAETGIVPVMVAHKLLGEFGLIVFIAQLVVAVLSTGAAELTAISSLFSYDIFRDYIAPNSSHVTLKRVSQISIGVVGIFMGGLGVLLDLSELSLGFVYLATGIFISSAVAPISLTLLWSAMSSAAAITSVISGLIFGVIAWGLTALIIAGNISVHSLGLEISMLCGNLGSLLFSFVVCLVWGILRPAHFDFRLLDREYRASIGIDDHFSSSSSSSPLLEEISKSSENQPLLSHKIEDDYEDYSKKLDKGDKHQMSLSIKTPSEESINKYALKLCYYRSLYVGVILTIILAIAWPIPMYISNYVFSEKFFLGWVCLAFVWSIIGTVVIIVLPIAESRKELLQMWRKIVPFILRK